MKIDIKKWQCADCQKKNRNCKLKLLFRKFFENDWLQLNFWHLYVWIKLINCQEQVKEKSKLKGLTEAILLKKARLKKDDKCIDWVMAYVPTIDDFLHQWFSTCGTCSFLKTKYFQ